MTLKAKWLPILIHPEDLAEDFHNYYEEAAKKENWKTQESCHISFSDLPVENRRTMIETCRKILEKYTIVQIIDKSCMPSK